MSTQSNTNFLPHPTAPGGEPSMLSPQIRPPQQELQQQPQQTQRIPGRRPQTVRTSCDSCAAAKVRCSKERPICERCIECNFSCVYGLSMKHGKGTQKRRPPESHPATNGFQPTPVTSEQKYENELQRSFSDLLENVGSTATVSSTQLWPFSNDPVMQSATIQSAPPTTAYPTFDDAFWNNTMAMDHTGTITTETMNSACHGQSNVHLKSLDDTLSLLPNMDFSQLMNTEPYNSLSSSSSSSSPVPSNWQTPSLPSQWSSDSPGTHDCYVIANSTLSILHVPPRPIANDCGNDAMSTLSSNSTSRAPTQPVQRLDEVLRCTKEARGNMLHLLKCACASDPQMAMLGASIIIRILYWHQLAAGIKSFDTMPLPSWERSPFMDPFTVNASTASKSHRSSCSTPTAFVASEPIKIGNYLPDQEDQESIRRMYLLIRLKKLGRLIETFAQVEDPGGAGPVHLRVILTSWLNSELSQAIKVVGAGTKTSDG